MTSKELSEIEVKVNANNFDLKDVYALIREIKLYHSMKPVEIDYP